MAPHTITPDVGTVCHSKEKAGLRRSPQGLHTRTRLSSLLRLKLDSSPKTTWFHYAAVQFPRAWHHSKRRRRWVGVKGSTRNGRRDPNVLQPGAFAWFEKTQEPLMKMLPVPE
ncbi:e3 ubiquitin-protein ligase RNF13 [Trichonephila clavipes]|nr:e3 ubiquitin-protein ligase RNF13 [Trichonephila clavipes]